MRSRSPAIPFRRLSTRKADTEIELKNGQSFAISGLLDHRITDNLSKIPGIGDIPILGQLFRSQNLNHSTTELIVIVTPTIVEPLAMPSSDAPCRFPSGRCPSCSRRNSTKGCRAHESNAEPGACRYAPVRECRLSSGTPISRVQKSMPDHGWARPGGRRHCQTSGYAGKRAVSECLLRTTPSTR